ncbi:GNAT family N-acetyltransferase [Pseudonocardia nigra]|uniref:GNAT family N-acetyltransferase n=1 Tax=Pseudonocardia nigra TaxID=1921578 RepID=UPI001C5E46A6|nr:GNAT family N-acetyltransferase [Pseudonocardia nigra]
MIARLDPEHVEALTRFFDELPTGDLTFIKEDVTDPATIRSWAAEGAGLRWVALDGATVTGYVAVRPLTGWSDHVGEIRLVVHPAHRRTGLGRELARHALARSVEAGLAKVVVELVADQEHALAMFTALGFTGEALLRDHIRDRDGRFRDLVMLAHDVDGTWSGMRAVGLADELGRENA